MSSGWSDFVAFRTMITPVVVKVVFGVGVVGSILGGILGIIGGLVGVGEASPAQVILGSVLLLLLGPIVTRVICELYIIQFRIYDVLTEIRSNTQRSAAE